MKELRKIYVQICELWGKSTAESHLKTKNQKNHYQIQAKENTDVINK